MYNFGYFGKNIFTKLNLLSLGLLILSQFGILFVSIKYSKILNIILQIYVGLFLILHFNPFYKFTSKNYDPEFNRTLSFLAGIYIIMNLSVVQYLKTRILD